MGVPALFRWLTKKYPKIITPVVEEQPYEIDGQVYPVNITKPNPNGEEMHNLYLDFNGIVHPCSHPEDKPPPATEAEMMMEIFKYTDRVVNMVRPRRLLLIAIDGVAPRAKMNQQRARRFRAARDAKEADEKKQEFQTLLRKQQGNGHRQQEKTVEEVAKKTWDTNVITPGTPFMEVLALSVRYWVQWKLNTDPAWENLKVIISDATVPGEGEHKIMQFVRSQRSDPEYDPNTRHVFYGLDADLIMLGIATHEPHFRILREDVQMRDAKAKTCNLCGQQGHFAENCRGSTKEKSGKFDEKGTKPELKPFVWLNVPILREYLGAEMHVPGQPFPFDLERALDDWVFMCFFVGNDFLPHLPSLDIHEDGIDKLIAIWRDNIPIMGGYLTCDGSVDLARAQCILQGLAKQEDAIFRRRKEVEDKREKNQQRRKREDEAREQARSARDSKRRRSSPDYGQGSGNGYAKGRSDAREPSTPSNLIPASSLSVQVDYNMIVNRGAVDKANAANKSAAAALKAQLLAKNGKGAEVPAKDGLNGANTDTSPITNLTSPSALGKRKADLLEEPDLGTPGRSTPLSSTPTQAPEVDLNELPPDNVRLWEEGYADRYYEQKFKVAPDDIDFRHQVARSYVEGLCWVLLYYFQGCPSWTWYYPYHYAPFAADFTDLDKLKIKFEKGKPFRPYEQLMGVLPAASNHAIPTSFHPLMTDEDSEIIDFYPEEFDLDANGKKQSWKAIVLLPFIDEKRLLDAMGTKYPLLSAEEHARNELGKDALLLSDRNPLYNALVTQFYSKKSKELRTTYKLPMRIGALAGVTEKNDGFLPHMSLVGPQDDINLQPEVDDDRSFSVHFTMPPATHIHKSQLLRGLVPPAKVLGPTDLAILKSKARNSGRDFGGAPLYDNTRQHPQDRNGNGYGGGGGRSGRISYAADRQPPGAGVDPDRGGGLDQSNPFAAFLDPKFVPGMGAPSAGGPPPPHQHGGGNRASLGGRGNGGFEYGYGGSPQARGQGQGQGYGHHGGNGSYQDQYRGGGQGYNDQGDQQYNGAGGYPNGSRRSASDGHYYQGQNQGHDNNPGRGGGRGNDSYRGSHDPRFGNGYGRR